MSSGFTRAPPVSSVLVWEICGSTIAVVTVGDVRVCAVVTGSVQVSLAVLVRLGEPAVLPATSATTVWNVSTTMSSPEPGAFA